MAITWETGFHESYAVTDRGTYAQLTVAEHEYPDVSTVYSSVYGSNAALDDGATITEIYDSVALDFTSHVQNWDEATHDDAGTIYWSAYYQCTESPCLQGMHPEGYHTYFASAPEIDGRKTYGYHQLTEARADLDLREHRSRRPHLRATADPRRRRPARGLRGRRDLAAGPAHGRKHHHPLHRAPPRALATAVWSVRGSSSTSASPPSRGSPRDVAARTRPAEGAYASLSTRRARRSIACRVSPPRSVVGSASTHRWASWTCARACSSSPSFSWSAARLR